ncbi:HEPN domain-containing protein [Deferrisoma palaeochoriense]
MRSRDEISYRLALAEGFLREAEQDFELERWRSCVDNAQLSVENAGKAVLAIFGVPPKTHEPAQALVALLETGRVPDSLATELRSCLPDFLSLGSAEHFLTDYGDESTYTLPWELFTAESASGALEAARRCVKSARRVLVAFDSS